MPDLDRHLAYLQAEYAAAQAAPLSARKAMLVAALTDAYVDRLFAAQQGADDILEFRSGLATESEALGLVMALCAAREGGPRLVTEAVEVPLSQYDRLSVEDFMVSLYNAHTVQRLRIALPDGGRREAHEVLTAAIQALRIQPRVTTSV